MTTTLETRRNMLGFLGSLLVLGACREEPVLAGGRNGNDSPVSSTGGAGISPAPGQQPGSNTGAGHRPVPAGLPGIEGTVRDAAGRPVANAFVQAAAVGNSPAVPELAVFTDMQGYYHWPLQPGRYRIWVTGTGVQTEVVAEVPAGGRLLLDLVLR